jgi:hypothetical protein
MITLSVADLFAVMLALFSSITILILAFRRIAVLETKVENQRRELRLLSDPTIWSQR